MGKHRKPAQKGWGPYVTTGVALEVATLFAFAYATDSHVPGANLLAQTSIFVDGTKSILGNEEGVPFYRMADSFQGAYSGAAYDEKFVIYPRSLGPLTRASFGGGTTADETKVLQVTKQYDGVADSPDYVFNVAADANAILGYYYLHSGYYKDVPAVPEDIDPNDPPDGMIVSTNENGNVTDVVLVAPEGQLPLTMPLRQLGVPEDVLIALDPFLRSVIETGYHRPEGEGAYPDEPVPFRLVPPPDQWLANTQAVSAGAAETAQRLSALGQPAMPAMETAGADARLAQGSSEPLVERLPGPTDAQSSTAPSDVEEQVTLMPLSPLRDAFGIGTGPNKVEPPKRPAAGWKPGDVVRSVLNSRSPAAGGSNARDSLGAVRNVLSSLSKPPGSEPNPGTGGSTTSSATGSPSPGE